jgi:universal stress protein E
MKTVIRRILVAIKNPDARSQPGADKAMRIARTLGASVEFFNAISTPVFLEVAPLKGNSLAAIKREALTLRRKRIDRLVARATRMGVQASGMVTWDYPPYEAIVRRARTLKADLIVAECHTGRRLKPWLMRLTDWELLRTSPVPVLLLRDSRDWHRSPVFMASVDPLHSHAKPSALDDAVVDLADHFASKFAGNVTLVHANNPPLQPFMLSDPETAMVSLAAIYDAQKAADARAFAKFADRRYVRPENRLLLNDEPIAGIPRAARRLRANLVIMGAVSRSGLKRVFIGNTAERVLPALPCDVLVVKPAKFRSPVLAKPRGMRVTAPSPLALPV